MKWELFSETKAVIFNPVQMMKIEGVDEALRFLENYCRTAKIEEVDGNLFVRPRLNDSLEAIYLCAKILDFKCAQDKDRFFNQIEMFCPSLIQIEAVSQILMMKVSDFCFQSGTYQPIFDLIENETLSFSTAKGILLGAGEKIKPLEKAPEPEKPKAKSKFPGNKRDRRSKRIELD